MTYDNIVDRVLSNDSIVSFCPEGTNISPFCVGTFKGSKADCFLVSSPVEKNRELFTYKIKVLIENPEDIHCMEMGESKTCLVYDKQMDSEMIALYMELYPEVRKFAFSSELTEAQMQILTQFMQAWKGAVEEGIREKMEQVFPEFFEWEQQRE